MTISQVSSSLRNQAIQAVTNDSLPALRNDAAMRQQVVPLGPVRRQQDPTGLAQPIFPNSSATPEQVVARRAGMVLGKGRRDVPLSQLNRGEIRALARVQVGRAEAAGIQRNLRRAARGMRVLWQQNGETQLAAVAASMEKAPIAPGTMSLQEALAAIEATRRLQGASVAHQSTVPDAAALEQTPDGAMLTEFYIQFRHDLMQMQGPEFEPAGFKLFWSTEPPAADNSNAVREIDVPVESDQLLRDRAANTYNVHFAEVDSELANGTQYYMWAIAYNNEGESIHSNHVQATYTARVRGDLNGDGAINMIDVNQMLEILLDGQLPFAVADINQDGDNTQEDLDLLVDMVNNQ